MTVQSVIGTTNQYGRDVYEPGASAAVNVNSTARSRAIHTTPIVAIGRSLIGKPMLADGSGVNSFKDPFAPRIVLGNCPMARLIELMYDGTPDDALPCANNVDHIRVPLLADITQAALSLVRSAVAVMLATSVEYGEEANKVQVKILNNSGLRDVYTRYIGKGGKTFQYIGLGNAITVLYHTGGGSAATLSVAYNGSDEAITLTTTVTGDAPSNLSISLADYPTLSSLVSYIDSLPNYTATVAAGVDGSMPSKYLDNYGSVDLAAISILTTAANVKAQIGSIIWATRNDPYVIFTRVATKVLVCDPVTVWTPLAGGTGGPSDTADATDYAAALAYLERQNHRGGVIFPESTDTDTLQTITAWIDQQREVHNNIWWMDCAVKQSSGGTQTTKAERIAQLQALNHVHTSCWHEGVTCKNYLGVPETSTLFGAAIFAGLDAGSGLRIPLTRKPIRISGVENRLSKADREEFIRAGGTGPIWVQGQGWLINFAVTTHTGDDKRINFIKSERRLVDAINMDIILTLEAGYPGQWGTKARISAAQMDVYKILDFWSRFPNERFQANPADPDSVPFSISPITLFAGKLQVKWNGYIGGEIDFIESTGNIDYQLIEQAFNVNSVVR